MLFQNYIITASSITAIDPIILIYLVPLAIVLSVLGWMYLRRRQLTQTIAPSTLNLVERKTTRPLLAQPPGPFVTQTRKSPPPLPVSHATSTESADIFLEPDTTTRAEFSIHHAAARRHCSSCKQFYDAKLGACPHKACPPPPPPNSDTLSDNDLQRTQCTQCSRRFENGTRYCYVDGMPLTSDTTEDAAKAPPIKVCRICGQEAHTHLDKCPHDNTELTLINPGNLNRTTPAIPLLICSKCRQYAMPGTAFCPNDGELLTPLVSAKFAALPASGFGPRRKLCRKCGTRYSDACTFCSQDGTPLTEIQ